MLGHRTLTLEDYVSILKRRGWIILVPVIVLPIVAFAATFLVAPQYLSQTLVIIEGQKVPDNYVKPVISSDLDSRLASMKEQILSRSSIQPIIERYNLYAGKAMSMDDRIDLARRSIEIKPIASEIAHSSGLPGFFVSFKAGDAHTAQLVCGDITSLFLGENLRSREASAQGTTDFLKSQLADAKRNLDEHDAKLANFQRQYIGRLPGEEQPNVNMLTSLNTQLDAATQALSRMEQDKAYEEAMLAQQSSQSFPSSSAAGPSQVGTPEGRELELQSLLAQEADLTSHYTSDYPDVIAVKRKVADLRREMARTPAAPAVQASVAAPSRNDSTAVQQLRAQIHSADIGIQAKRKDQAQIQSQIGMYQSRIQSSPLVEQEYKELTRDYQTAQTFYDDLLTKMNQSKMATDLEKRQQGEQFRVMDEPNLPDAPFSPKRSVFVMGGLVGGLALGLLIVGLLEYSDTSLRNERDVWAFTKLPTLGVISFSDSISTVAPQGRLASLRQSLSRKLVKPAATPVGG
jgi:polysaccharide chain length determinant protein (PEP-CTERM system associated)